MFDCKLNLYEIIGHSRNLWKYCRKENVFSSRIISDKQNEPFPHTVTELQLRHVSQINSGIAHINLMNFISLAFAESRNWHVKCNWSFDCFYFILDHICRADT